LPGTDTKVFPLQQYSAGWGQAPPHVEVGGWRGLERFCLFVIVLSTITTSSLRNYFKLTLHHLLPKLKILHASFKAQLKNNCSAGASFYSATS